MNPFIRRSRCRTSALGLLTASALLATGAAAAPAAPAPAPAAEAAPVQASTLGAQAAQSGRYFGTAVAAGKLGDTHLRRHPGP